MEVAKPNLNVLCIVRSNAYQQSIKVRNYLEPLRHDSVVGDINFLIEMSRQATSKCWMKKTKTN